MKLFTVGTAVNHHVGDAQGPECWELYPEPCRCGGLMHAATGEEEDLDGSAVVSTRCDQCGRSDEDLAEAV